MEAKIIFFSQKNIPPKIRTKFKKEFSGHNDASHGGRYTYRVKGILDEIRHIKPCNGAVIVEERNYNKLTALIQKYGMVYKTYTIIVSKKELKK